MTLTGTASRRPMRTRRDGAIATTYPRQSSTVAARGVGGRCDCRLRRSRPWSSSQLKELLESPQRLLDLLSEVSSSPDDVQRLLEAIQRPGDSSDKTQSLLKSAVARIVVYDEQIEVQIDKRALRRELLGQEVDSPMQSSTEDDYQSAHPENRCAAQALWRGSPLSAAAGFKPRQSSSRSFADSGRSSGARLGRPHPPRRVDESTRAGGSNRPRRTLCRPNPPPGLSRARPYRGDSGRQACFALVTRELPRRCADRLERATRSVQRSPRCAASGVMWAVRFSRPNIKSDRC